MVFATLHLLLQLVCIRNHSKWLLFACLCMNIWTLSASTEYSGLKQGCACFQWCATLPIGSKSMGNVSNTYGECMVNTITPDMLLTSLLTPWTLRCRDSIYILIVCSVDDFAPATDWSWKLCCLWLPSSLLQMQHFIIVQLYISKTFGSSPSNTQFSYHSLLAFAIKFQSIKKPFATNFQSIKYH